MVREGLWEEVNAESVCGELGEQGSRLRRQQRKRGGDAPRMPNMVSGWQVLNKLVSNGELRGWGGFAGTGRQVKGFIDHLLARASELLVPAVPTPGGPLRQNEGRAQAPVEAQAWRSPARKEPALVPPLPHWSPVPSCGPVSIMRPSVWLSSLCWA